VHLLGSFVSALISHSAFLNFLFVFGKASVNDILEKKAITKVKYCFKKKKKLRDVNMTELEIAVAPMHRLCKKAGADRVSEAAAKELAKALEEIGVKIAKEALDFAMHAGRKTIKAEDIEIAAKKVMGK
jgi:DNA-binding protein